MIIDCEPTWEQVLDIAKHAADCNSTDARRHAIETLRPACKIADIVRRAQKMGAKSITFTLENGINIKED